MEFALIVLGSLLFIGFLFYCEHVCTKRNEQNQHIHDWNVAYYKERTARMEKLRNIHK